MIIQSDSVRMSAQRSYEEHTRSTTTYAYWNLSTQANAQTSIHMESHYQEHDTSSDSSDNSNSRQEEDYQKKTDELFHHFQSMQSIHGIQMQEQLKSLDELRQQGINYLLYLLFGKKGDAPDTSIYKSTTSNNTVPSVYEGGSYSSSFYYNEQEHTCFDARGTVQTADGRQIPINISVEMSRSFTEYTSTAVNYGAPMLCDPLVINLSGTASSNITDQKFFFDLDADGQAEEISSFSSGTGFLALDLNEDGRINDGKELFGTTSGNGFADLVAYDTDQNGWIDEADDIFQKLTIWTRDEHGNDVLTALGKAGIGAIYLGSKDTNYTIKSMQTNETYAVVRKTGIFLYENGNVGNVQQLDLAR